MGQIGGLSITPMMIGGGLLALVALAFISKK
jgi:hypothetical protein